MTDSHVFEVIATVLFGVAVLHTFAVKQFQHLASKYPEGSVGENLFHLLGEIEVVFGFWAAVLVIIMAIGVSGEHAVSFVEGANFTEPLFVFAIMTIAATRPILEFATAAVGAVARVLPIAPSAAFLFAALVVGPLFGSFITEPAAMTVTALIIRDRFFSRGISSRLMYLILGTLFVNVSIGGVLTPFAAPPVLMVAGTWKWDLGFMFNHFGWKAVVAVAANSALVTAYGVRELRAMPEVREGKEMGTPLLLMALHLLFLGLVVLTSHHASVFMGIFLFFLGLTAITKEYQSELNLKQSLLVAFFLSGLVVFGGLQRWWLEPLLRDLSPNVLFLGATALTAVTDNAALTYLGSQIPNVSDAFKYALVSGAVVGGGLTVIANAPNPAGFSILRDSFGEEGISPVGLLTAAFVPTLIAMASFWLLPY